MTLQVFSVMENAELYARCTYMLQTTMFFLDVKMNFDDIVREICFGFKFLKAGSFDLRYTLPGYPSCVLESDRDVKLMFRSLVECKVSSVDILARDCGGSSTVTSGGTSLFDDGSLYLSTASKNDSIDENEYLGCFRPEAAKSYLSNEWHGYISYVGQKFEGGVLEFRDKLCKFAIESGFMFAYKRNCPSRVIAHCSKRHCDGCQWFVRALKNNVNGFFYIKELNNIHTCKGVLRQQKSQLLGSHIVKSVISDELKSNPGVKPKEIISRFKNSFGLDVSYKIAWYGRELARKSLHGDDGDSYSQLAWYQSVVLSTNPGSYCILESNPLTNRFERFFICFAGCIEGFKSCIPLLFVDAAHLKSKFKGYMLCATGKNGNQGVISFLFAFSSYDSSFK